MDWRRLILQTSAIVHLYNFIVQDVCHLLPYEINYDSIEKRVDFLTITRWNRDVVRIVKSEIRLYLQLEVRIKSRLTTWYDAPTRLVKIWIRNRQNRGNYSSSTYLRRFYDERKNKPP